MKKTILAMCIGVAAPALLLGTAIYVRHAGTVVTYDGDATWLVAALDTNRLSGTQMVVAGLYNTQGQRLGARGVLGWVQVGDLANPGDAAFGNVDTAIIQYYTSIEGVRTIFETDTLAGLPDTSWVWDDADSIWHYADVFGFGWYLADSTEDYSGSDDTMECTMSYMLRVFEE